MVRRFASLTVLSSLLFLSSTSFAQETEDGFSNGLGSAPSEPEAEEPQEEPQAEPPLSETQEKEEGAPPTQVQASAEVSLGGDQVGEPKVAPTDDVPKPPPLALEVLPPSAYPNDPIAGIRGGSLGFVLSGMQWPYMPAYGDDQPKLRIGISGSSWVDFNYRAVRPGRAIEPDAQEGRVQGRLTLRVSPVYNFKDGWFGQSRIEFVGITEQQHEANKYVDLDEAWVRFGKWNAFDVTVGRTQGFEVYHFGMGMDINTGEREGARPIGAASGQSIQQPYALTELWDRGINNGAIAFHVYTPKWLRLEMLGRMGLTAGGNDLGIRPAGIIDLGWIKLKGGYEYRVQVPFAEGRLDKTETKGFAGSVNFVFDPWIEFGGGVAHRLVDVMNVSGGPDVIPSSDTTTFGGFLNVRPYFEDWLVGLGYHNTYWENFNYNSFGEAENQTHEQMFGAVQYQLWDRFFFKYVLSYSRVHIENRSEVLADEGYVNQQISHRMRFMMLF